MRRSRVILGVILAWLVAGSGHAQETPPDDARATITAGAVEAQIAELEAAEASGELSAEDQTRLQLYRGALESLQVAEAAQRRRQESAEQQSQSAVELEAIRAELAQPPETLQPQAPPDATLSDLEEALRAARSELEAARSRLEEVESERAGREAQADEIRDQIASAQVDLEATNARLAALPLADESPGLTLARRTKLLADRLAQEAAIAALQQGRQNYDARTELLPLLRERWVRRVAQLSEQQTAWQAIVDEARAADIRIKAEQAARAAALAHPLVVPIAEANVALARRRDVLRPQLDAAQHALTELSPDPQVLRRQFQRLDQKVKAVGMTATVGLLLRKTRDELPDVRVRENSIRQRRVKMADLEFQRLELEDTRETLIADQEAMIKGYLARLGPTVPAAEQAAIETEIREQLRLKREYLDALGADLARYFDRLEALNEKEQQIVNLTEELISFIDRRILWIRSARTLGTGDLVDSVAALRWMFDLSDWRRIARGLGPAVRARWPLAIGSLLLLAMLLAVRRWLGGRIRTIGGGPAPPEAGTFGQALAVTAGTIVKASVLPVALWLVGAWLHWADPDGQIDLAVATGAAFKESFPLAFILLLAYETCQPRGLGVAHFGWRPDNVRVARRYLGWLAVIILGCGIPVSIVNHQNTHAHESSLGRVLFIAAVVGLAICVHGLFNPRTGILRDYLRRNPGGWANRLRYVWYPVVLLAPISIAVASFIGYHFTALEICTVVLNSAGFLVVVVLVYYLVLHWIHAGQHKLALEQARRLAAASEEREARGEADGGEAPPPVEATRIDVSALRGQAVQLLRGAVLFAVLIGGFVIWSDTLPAIGFLERVELWAGAEEITVASTAEEIAAGAPATQTVYEKVTLAHLLLSLVLLVITVIVAKNIPGLLEITVLQHLPLERGSQFALSTIVRYTITIVGVVVAFRFIGVTWAKVQWLAAALTVGLGFGLNEIFGNFISGLIILFERPIRVGDTITVGNITGTVRQIRIRATTLMDWDRKELVIPNKTFVTDTITNWTLTDPILRLVFPIVLDHRADTALAEKLLLKAAADHPLVLGEPAPSVWFRKVGEQGLELDLRLFIPHIDHLVKAKHEVHNAIVNAFREHGVRFFAFSQRDIRVQSLADDASLET